MPAPSIGPQEQPEFQTVFTPRPVRALYVVSYVLAIILAICELGFVSEQIHKGGKNSNSYPGREFHHAMGVLLFSSVATMIHSGYHFKLGAKAVAFCTFTLAFFWGTGAGIVFQVSPFHVYSCKFDIETFEPIWQPFFSQCSRIVAIEAFAWAEFGLHCLILILIAADCVSLTWYRPHFYAKTKDETSMLKNENFDGA